MVCEVSGEEPDKFQRILNIVEGLTDAIALLDKRTKATAEALVKLMKVIEEHVEDRG